jgi:hypothetical protein
VKKIPTVFVRNPDDRRHVLSQVTPGCEWVLAGEGRATRKYDGTCVRVNPDGTVWARREVKAGKIHPDAFVSVEMDPTTGKTVGWEPGEQSGFWKYIEEAHTDQSPGTYELCGPKVNGNPEKFDRHVLVPHGLVTLDCAPRDFDGLRDYLTLHAFEGIVWHHPDGRMAKLKRRDFS